MGYSHGPPRDLLCACGRARPVVRPLAGSLGDDRVGAGPPARVRHPSPAHATRDSIRVLRRRLPALRSLGRRWKRPGLRRFGPLRKRCRPRVSDPAPDHCGVEPVRDSLSPGPHAETRRRDCPCHAARHARERGGIAQRGRQPVYRASRGATDDSSVSRQADQVGTDDRHDRGDGNRVGSHPGRVRADWRGTCREPADCPCDDSTDLYHDGQDLRARNRCPRDLGTCSKAIVRREQECDRRCFSRRRAKGCQWPCRSPPC